jgi:hypothetical protein
MTTICSTERPRALRSSWTPVMPSTVPETLKSMSPKKSSSPRMSVTKTSLPPFSSVKRPTEMPAQVLTMGTPASMRARQPPQTEAIDDEPLDSVMSLTRRMV